MSRHDSIFRHSIFAMVLFRFIVPTNDQVLSGHDFLADLQGLQFSALGTCNDGVGSNCRGLACAGHFWLRQAMARHRRRHSWQQPPALTVRHYRAWMRRFFWFL
jgi:hypothetical protein